MNRFGLVGKNIHFSFSPDIFKLLGIEYQLFDIEQDQLASFIISRQYDCLNVTIPYKQAVIPLLDELDDTAKQIGAVNVIVNKNGRLIGYNTDFGGLLFGLEKAGIRLTDKNVVILGSGGASKCCNYLARMQNAKSIVTLSRNEQGDYQRCYEQQQAQFLINATPIGNYSLWNCSPLNDLDKLPNLEGVFDLVYNPLSTQLILQAKKMGLLCDNGLGMLVKQALLSLQLFANQKFDDTLVNRTLQTLRKQKSNVVLSGCSGCGKSVIGKSLATALNREHVDTDELFEQTEGMSIPAFFEKYGENEFRQKESEIIGKVASRLGIVISLGGGSALMEKNRQMLALNGVTFNLIRNLENIDIIAKPPYYSNVEATKKLYQQRASVNQEFCQYSIDNNGSVNTAVQQIRSIYEKHFSN